MRYLVKLYTGPAIVDAVARCLRSAGLDVKLVGTEHVYVEADGADPRDAARSAGADAYRSRQTTGLGPWVQSFHPTESNPFNASTPENRP